MGIPPTTNTGAATVMQSSYMGDSHLPQDSDSISSSPSTPAGNSETNLVRPPTTEHVGSATSKTHSERDDLPADLRPLPQQRSTSLSSLRPVFSKDSKGKGRPASLHSGSHTRPSSYQSTVQEPAPAPPREVLTREATEEPTTSAGAAAILQQDLQPPTQDTDIVMRDRMLVRILHSKQDASARYMDETYLAEITEVKQEEWGEFIVVWRRGRIELYEDYVCTRLMPATRMLTVRSIDDGREGMVLGAQAPCVRYPSSRWVYEGFGVLANRHVDLPAMPASARARIPEPEVVPQPEDGDEPIPAADQEPVKGGRLDVEVVVCR